MRDRVQLTVELKAESHRLGFDLVGACPAASPAGFARFQKWLECGFDGEMRYLRQREQAYAHPSHVLPSVRSLLMLAMQYRTAEPSATNAGEGRVARYAWGPQDYHDLIHDRLRQLATRVKQLAPDAQVRGVVDTAPILEREFARAAGLGWIAKNTMLINKHVGSWFFLAALLTNLELDYDQPHEADHCGTCRACLDACPTQAFPEPYVLDATKCISYLTIELRGQTPTPSREQIGEWLFGCDICQEVCPWNRGAPISAEPSFWPAKGEGLLPLAQLFSLDEGSFRAHFRDTAMWRSRRQGLLRNAAIVLGNQRAADSVEALAQGLRDEDAVVRSACAWALGKIGGPAAVTALTARFAEESDPPVAQEIKSALDTMQ